LGNRRWIVYVLAVSFLVPFLLEGWTFYTMFRNVLVGSPEAERSASSSESTNYFGSGDEVLPSTSPREVLRSMAIENRGDTWIFTLTMDIRNTTEHVYRLDLTEVVLQDGTVVTTTAHQTVESGDERTFEVRLSLPEGTIPRVLRMDAGGDTEGRGGDREEIPLSSVPVRKHSS